MVRTRGLGCALGKVIGRVPGREYNRDSDDASQRRRPTASARRQWEAAAVAEDAPHGNDIAEEVFQHAEEVVNDAKGFAGGPHDTSVLTAYVDHVAVIIWNRGIFSF